MIHYHGTPITPDVAAASILAGRHAMVSFKEPRQLDLVADVCQSFALDNGAFSAWRGGHPITDWEPFYAWVSMWRTHPAFDFALIPDVIDGTEADNETLINAWPLGLAGVPIWHLHESIDKFVRLSYSWPRVALGSSGEYAQIGTSDWWHRMSVAMMAVCDSHGRPAAKLHGLRMLDPEIFSRFPFASADSTNIARNIGIDGAWRGSYLPPDKAVRGYVLAERIESRQSAPKWDATGIPTAPPPTQLELLEEIA